MGGRTFHFLSRKQESPSSKAKLFAHLIGNHHLMQASLLTSSRIHPTMDNHSTNKSSTRTGSLPAARLHHQLITLTTLRTFIMDRRIIRVDLQTPNINLLIYGVD
ncbi:hypothetical protein BSL78_12391 [Apostichopus japonicus]|uniref:Uncharacterized protein n=1 Tax=Stichopus japonicus TaxID=307972 RepID=A0A2G8KRZ1_STIJA|nr:hypothetical protein BSL78_12391 [Apostichopus japonicus]